MMNKKSSCIIIIQCGSLIFTSIPDNPRWIFPNKFTMLFRGI